MSPRDTTTRQPAPNDKEGGVMTATISNQPESIVLATEDAAALWSVFSAVQEMTADDIRLSAQAGLEHDDVDRRTAIETGKLCARLHVASIVAHESLYNRLSGETDFAAAAAIAAEQLSESHRDYARLSASPETPSNEQSKEYALDVANCRRALRVLADLSATGGMTASMVIDQRHTGAYREALKWLWYHLAGDSAGEYDGKTAPAFACDIGVLHRALTAHEAGQVPASFNDRYRLYEIVTQAAETLTAEIEPYTDGSIDLSDEHRMSDYESLAATLRSYQAVLASLGNPRSTMPTRFEFVADSPAAVADPAERAAA